MTNVAAPTGVVSTDTSAIQSAHDALPSVGGEIRLQAGFYAIAPSGIAIRKPVRVVGTGATDWNFTGGTALFCNSANANGITVNADACVFEDLAIINNYKVSGKAISGTGLMLGRASLTNINRCMIFGFFNNVAVQSGAYWSMTHSKVFSPINHGILIQNSSGADTGDMLLDDVKFDTVGAISNPASAIRWETGSGLRVVNCKFNGNTRNWGGNFQYATFIDCAWNGSTIDAGDMFIQNNSIENCSGVGVKLSRTAGSRNMYNTMIQGNEFQNMPVGIQVGAGWVTGIILGNLFDSGVTGISQTPPRWLVTSNLSV